MFTKWKNFVLKKTFYSKRIYPCFKQFIFEQQQRCSEIEWNKWGYTLTSANTLAFPNEDQLQNLSYLIFHLIRLHLLLSSSSGSSGNQSRGNNLLLYCLLSSAGLYWLNTFRWRRQQMTVEILISAATSTF